MQSVKEIIKMPVERGANSPFTEQIENVCQFMDGDMKRFKYWCGRLRLYSPSQIYDLIQHAKLGEHPQKLFNYLLKKQAIVVKPFLVTKTKQAPR